MEWKKYIITAVLGCIAILLETVQFSTVTLYGDIISKRSSQHTVARVLIFCQYLGVCIATLSSWMISGYVTLPVLFMASLSAQFLVFFSIYVFRTLTLLVVTEIVRGVTFMLTWIAFTAYVATLSHPQTTPTSIPFYQTVSVIDLQTRRLLALFFTLSPLSYVLSAAIKLYTEQFAPLNVSHFTPAISFAFIKDEIKLTCDNAFHLHYNELNKSNGSTPAYIPPKPDPFLQTSLRHLSKHMDVYFTGESENEWLTSSALLLAGAATLVLGLFSCVKMDGLKRFCSPSPVFDLFRNLRMVTLLPAITSCGALTGVILTDYLQIYIPCTLGRTNQLHAIIFYGLAGSSTSAVMIFTPKYISRTCTTAIASILYLITTMILLVRFTVPDIHMNHNITMIVSGACIVLWTNQLHTFLPILIKDKPIQCYTIYQLHYRLGFLLTSSLSDSISMITKLFILLTTAALSTALFMANEMWSESREIVTLGESESSAMIAANYNSSAITTASGTANDNIPQSSSPPTRKKSSTLGARPKTRKRNFQLNEKKRRNSDNQPRPRAEASCSATEELQIR